MLILITSNMGWVGIKAWWLLCAVSLLTLLLLLLLRIAAPFLCPRRRAASVCV